MKQFITNAAVVVLDFDEIIDFYTNRLFNDCPFVGNMKVKSAKEGSPDPLGK